MSLAKDGASLEDLLLRCTRLAANYSHSGSIDAVMLSDGHHMDTAVNFVVPYGSAKSLKTSKVRL
jgi:hypothetical protein